MKCINSKFSHFWSTSFLPRRYFQIKSHTVLKGFYTFLLSPLQFAQFSRPGSGLQFVGLTGFAMVYCGYRGWTESLV